jgi:DNA repair exonuclease SbcCD nuclease subunit
MKILITADIHCGYPGKLNDNIWSLNAISDYAKKHKIKKIACLGDFYHNRDHLTLDVINATHEYFRNCEQEWIMFPGNHDMFMKTSWDINSVKPLEKYATIYNEINEFELDGRKFVILPFIHYEVEYMAKIKELEEEGAILLTHIGVNNAVNNSCFLLKHWSSVHFNDTKFSLVLSGHFHNHQSVDNKIYYPGSPIPFRFDEGMVPHGFMVLDTKTLELEFVNLREIRDDCPEDFITLTDDIVDDMIDGKDSGSISGVISNNKVRVSLSKEYSKPELDIIRDACITNGADSVSWMRSIKETQKISEGEHKTDDTRAPFIQWLENNPSDKFDDKLLKDLYASIAEEAEDLYIKSREEE